MKTKLGCTVAILGVFVTQPIWYYLLYQVLVRVQASDLMWFLFWIYLPVSLLMGVVGAIFQNVKE